MRPVKRMAQLDSYDPEKAKYQQNMIDLEIYISDLVEAELTKKWINTNSSYLGVKAPTLKSRPVPPAATVQAQLDNSIQQFRQSVNDLVTAIQAHDAAQERNCASEVLYWIKAINSLYSNYRSGKVTPLNAQYGKARNSLVNVLGNYCCYCDIQVNENHIEHVLPKYWFPQQYLEWNNFLLACSYCNTSKGEEPSPLATIAAFRVAAPGWTYPGAYSDAAFRQATSNLFCWPEHDTTPTYNLVSDAFMFQLNEVSYNDRHERIAADPYAAFDPQIAYNQVVAGNLLLSVGFESGPTVAIDYNGQEDIEVELFVRSQGTLTDQADRTISMMNLNRERGKSVRETFGDLRVPNRTRAFLNAFDSLEVFANAATENQITSMVRLLVRTIAQTGFWSVWWYFFNAYVPAFTVTVQGKQVNVSKLITNRLYDELTFPGTYDPTPIGEDYSDSDDGTDGMNYSSEDYSSDSSSSSSDSESDSE